MKKMISIIMFFLSISVCLFSTSCINSNEWRTADITGYYVMGGGSSYSYRSCGIELHNEKINDETQTFVVRNNYDRYKNGDNVATEEYFYVSYGYYTIEKTYEEDEYIEYRLNLNYIVRDVNAPSWDTMTVTVKKDGVYCNYNGQSLKQQ